MLMTQWVWEEVMTSSADDSLFNVHLGTSSPDGLHVFHMAGLFLDLSLTMGSRDVL